MTYMLSYKRRFMYEVRDDFLKHFVFLTNPKRYVEVFAPLLVDAIVEEGSLPVDPREFDKIDSYLASLDKVRGASGAQLADDEGWL